MSDNNEGASADARWPIPSREPEEEDQVDEEDEEEGQDTRFRSLEMAFELMDAGLTSFPEADSDDEDDEDDEDESSPMENYYMPLDNGDEPGSSDADNEDTDEADPTFAYERLPSSSRAPTYMVDRGQFQMSDDAVDLVKSIMSSITLPPDAIPGWASVVAEEDWFPRVVYRDHNPGLPETSED